jgi:hypothetical protein
LILGVFLVTKRGRFALIGLSLFVIFFSVNFISNLEKARLKEFVVFNIGKKTLVSFRSGEKLIFIDVDTSKIEFNDKYEFFTKSYISKVCDKSLVEVFNPCIKDIKSSFGLNQIASQKGLSVFRFNKEIIAIPFDKSLDKYMVNSKMTVDYLVINQFCSAKIFDFFNPKMVIVDPSVSKHKTSEIAIKCRQNGIPCYLVATQGAFIKTNS